MAKINLVTKRKREINALLCDDGSLWVRNHNLWDTANLSYKLCGIDFSVCHSTSDSLEDIFRKCPIHKPIYEGDKLEIEV